MSKLLNVLQSYAGSTDKVMFHLPGTGYVLGKVVKLEDDMVTIQPDDGKKVVMHYTQFSLRTN